MITTEPRGDLTAPGLVPDHLACCAMALVCDRGRIEYAHTIECPRGLLDPPGVLTGGEVLR